MNLKLISKRVFRFRSIKHKFSKLNFDYKTNAINSIQAGTLLLKNEQSN